MKILILSFVIMCAAESALACVGPTKKLVLPGTSFQNNPIIVRGGTLYFDYGTANVVSFSYDLEKNLWCTSMPGVGCLKPVGKSGQVQATVSEKTEAFYLKNGNGIFAKVEVAGKILKLFSSDDKKVKFTKNYFEISDESDSRTSQITIKSRTGAKVISQQSKDFRGVMSKSGEEGTVNMGVAGTTTLGNCGFVKACRRNSDCVKAIKPCSCCEFLALHKDLLGDLKKTVCEDPEPPCQCAENKAVVVCKQGRCELSK